VINIGFFAVIGGGIAAAVMFLWSLFLQWLALLFIVPFKNVEILWIIIPIWLGWFFSEFFQEKHSTSFGNAISNGAIALWVGIDWTRYLVNNLSYGNIQFGWGVIVKFALCIIVLGYGLWIIIEGVKAKKFIHFVGRIREVTYLLLVLSPIVYGIISFTWRLFLVIVIFAPIHYWFIEWIDRMTPNPKIYEEDDNPDSPSKPAAAGLDRANF